MGYQSSKDENKILKYMPLVESVMHTKLVYNSIWK